MSRECQILRVFTRDGVGGNHLGVVTDLAGLTTELMQGIAGDLGLSETIFCDVAGDVPVARIFTPDAEIPFAGHPLVGLGWALNDFHPGGIDRIRCEIGEVGVTREDGETWVQTAGDQPVDPADPSTVGAVEVSMVLMPIPYLVARLATPDLVGAATPPPEALGEVYLWAWEETGQTVKARFFAPRFGVPEDPATGSAAVALAAHLRAAGQNEGRLVIHQGDECGAPSTISLRWDDVSSTIGGTVVRDEVRRLDI